MKLHSFKYMYLHFIISNKIFYFITGYVLFSVFNVIWASLYLEAWRRYSVQLAFRWGTLGTPPDLLEPPRPMFTVLIHYNYNLSNIYNIFAIDFRGHLNQVQ